MTNTLQTAFAAMTANPMLQRVFTDLEAAGWTLYGHHDGNVTARHPLADRELPLWKAVSFQREIASNVRYLALEETYRDLSVTPKCTVASRHVRHKMVTESLKTGSRARGQLTPLMSPREEKPKATTAILALCTLVFFALTAFAFRPTAQEIKWCMKLRGITAAQCELELSK